MSAPFSQVWINQSDIILIGLRDYQDSRADVILKYSSDEARNLKAYGELPENGESGSYVSQLVELLARSCVNVGIFSLTLVRIKISDLVRPDPDILCWCWKIPGLDQPNKDPYVCRYQLQRLDSRYNRVIDGSLGEWIHPTVCLLCGLGSIFAHGGVFQRIFPGWPREDQSLDPQVKPWLRAEWQRVYGEPKTLGKCNWCVFLFAITAKINEDFGEGDGEDMITFDNNGDFSDESDDDVADQDKRDFDLDDLDDVSMLTLQNIPSQACVH